MARRIESREPAEPLTPRVEQFISERLRGVRLDDVLAADAERADYSCLGGLLAIELKTLEDDGSERIGNLVRELEQRDDWPSFLGDARLDRFIKNTSDPDGLMLRAVQRIATRPNKLLKKADDQLAAHKRALPRSNQVGAVVIVNEDHELYDSNLMGRILHHALGRRDAHGQPMHPNIDFALYVTERHVVFDGDLMAYPTILVEGISAGAQPWKGELASLVVSRWMEWEGQPARFGEFEQMEHATIERIPRVMPRFEHDKLAYRRRPYLRPLSEDQLFDRFDEIMAVMLVDTLKDAPLPRSPARLVANGRLFSDMTDEMAHRGIPCERFRWDPQRLATAADRVGLPSEVQEWLRTTL